MAIWVSLSFCALGFCDRTFALWGTSDVTTSWTLHAAAIDPTRSAVLGGNRSGAGIRVPLCHCAARQDPTRTWQQIAAHLLYLQDIFGYPEINDVFWTLCLELQFYLIYVLMLVVARNNLRLILILLFAAMALSAI
jgi:hypothetical protein